MKRKDFLKISAAGTASLAFPGLQCARAPQQADRPNIIVIMADDMGFSDAGCYGGEIDTPNIDRLADNGLRFTQFYNAARCCPTRACLMTGAYQHKVNMGRNGQTLGRNGLTIAEGLKEAGYNTSMLGKWHLSLTEPLDDKEKHQKWLNHQYTPDRPFSPIDSYPVNRGFDEHYGPIWGVVDYFDPYSLVEGEKPVKEVPDDYYITDELNDRAVETVKRLGKEDDPYFLYLAHCAPHWPLHALEEDIQKYKDRYKEGWDKLRQERYERQLEMGLFDKENTPLPPVQTRQTKAWDELSEEEKDYQASKMAVHAAMIDRMDQGIGRMIDALEETGQLNNTMIVFLSDNGASRETPKDWGPGFDRPSETRDGRKIHYQPDEIEDMGSQTSFAGIGPAWGSASNTPFRFWKMNEYEGGNHTPCIVHWPEGLDHEPGSYTEQVGHVMDFLPTFLELAETEYPEKYNGRELVSVDGKSLVPTLKGKQRKGYDQLYFEHVGGKALREGDWKVVQLNDNSPWRLYHLSEDRTETTDVSKQNPERFKRMIEDWKQWADQVGAS